MNTQPLGEEPESSLYWVDDGRGLPAVPFVALINGQLVTVTNVEEL